MATKYANRKGKEDGYTFDSQLELLRYRELKLLAKAGEIEAFQVKPRYVLLEGFRDGYKVTHRAITYTPDFGYQERSGQLVVEDTKGVETEAFKIKRKLFARNYPQIRLDVVKR